MGMGAGAGLNNPNPTMPSDASLQVPAAGGLAGGLGMPAELSTPTPTPPPGAPSDKRGGAVKKRALGGGSLKKDDDDSDDASDRVPAASGLEGGMGAPPVAQQPPVSQQQKRGGRVAKRQMGGGMPQQPVNTGLLGLGANPALRPTPEQQGAPTISGRRARPATPLMVPPPANAAAALRARPAPGTMVGFKRGGRAASRGFAGGTTTSYPDGGSPGKEVGQNIRKLPGGKRRGGAVHDDEAADRKLFRKMMKEEKQRGKA